MSTAKKRRSKHEKRRYAEPLILRTKLILPILKKNIIFRQRLVSLLNDNFDKRLTLVVADAGYGKTTLLAQLIKDKDLPIVFYDLDREDSDVMVFFAYLLQGLEQLQPYLVERTRGLLEYGTEITKNYKLVIGTLINELLEKRSEPLFLILDDYHTLFNDSMVHKVLDYFINSMPNTVRVLIASRMVPQLPSLTRWRSKQNLFELSRDKLMFTREEIKALLSGVYRVMLSDEELAWVTEYTEGWITGIQLVIQTAGKDRKTVKEILNGYVAANQPLFEYFANEILTAEIPSVQNFLKYSAVLEIMTPDACNTVLGMKNSIRLLRDLERRNLFLSEVSNDEYKYHHLFREFLQSRIMDKKLRRSLNLKAAQYYKKKGQTEQAIKHYLKVKNYMQTAKLIVQVENQMRIQARFTTLFTWFNQIPENILDKQPKLLTVLGRLHVVQGNRQQAEHIFIRAEQLLNKRIDKVALAEVLKAHASLLLEDELRIKDALKIIRKALKLCPAEEDELRIEILITIGRLWRRVWDFKKARPYLLKAYRIAERIKDTSKMITIINNLALQFVTQGEIRKAFKTFKQLIEQNKDNYWADVGIVFNNAVTNALALGKVEWAEQCLDKGWALCAPHEDLRSKVAIHRAFGVLYMQKSQWDLAEQHLLKAQRMAAKMNWTLMEFFLYRTTSRFYRYRGDMNKSEKYLNLMWQRLDKRDSPNEATLLTEMACLYVAQGQFEKADKVVKISSKLIKKYGLNVLRFYSFLVCAAIALEQHENQKALNFLKQAFRIAKIKGYDGLLMNELWYYPRLARFAQKSNIERNYILSLNIPKDIPKLHIRVQCFGGLRIRDKRGALLPLVWPTEKTRSLFAFLIAHRAMPLHREVILESLWPGLPKNRAHGNFRTTASRMRQSLTRALSGKLTQHEIFIRQHGKYQLLPEVKLDIDTQEFDLLLKEAERVGSDHKKVKIIRRALNIYTGDYVPEIYDTWSDILRRRYQEIRLRALLWLAKYFHDKGDDLGCIQSCETYLLLDPLSEDVVRLYMKGLSRLGRVAAVKTCYDALKKKLQDELDSTPSKETEELYHSLMRYHSKL